MVCYLQVLYVETKRNVADIFTKALAKSDFRMHRDCLFGSKLCGPSTLAQCDIKDQLSKYMVQPALEDLSVKLSVFW